MVARNWTEADTANACQFWQDYQAQNDVTSLTGKTAGIDPVTHKIWFGDSAAEIVEELERTGHSMPLYFVRVGFDHYLRKGARR